MVSQRFVQVFERSKCTWCFYTGFVRFLSVAVANGDLQRFFQVSERCWCKLWCYKGSVRYLSVQGVNGGFAKACSSVPGETMVLQRLV